MFCGTAAKCQARCTAAKAFVRKAIKGQGLTPRTITLDGHAASHRAVREMKADAELRADTKLRSSKYLNNLCGHSASASRNSGSTSSIVRMLAAGSVWDGAKWYGSDTWRQVNVAFACE